MLFFYKKTANVDRRVLCSQEYVILGDENQILIFFFIFEIGGCTIFFYRRGYILETCLMPHVGSDY